MGYFRVYKLTDYTAEECREHMHTLTIRVLHKTASIKQCEIAMEKWACFRELLARHEKQNKAPIDREYYTWGYEGKCVLPLKCAACKGGNGDWKFDSSAVNWDCHDEDYAASNLVCAHCGEEGEVEIQWPAITAPGKKRV